MLIKWSIPQISYKGEAYVICISPKEYIERIHIKHRMTPEQLKRYAERTKGKYLEYPPESEESKKIIRQKIQRGEVIEMPWIWYRKDLVWEQEGYHRALVTRDLGIDKIPVFIIEEKQEHLS